MDTISNRLKQERDRLGLSQQKMADIAGVSRQTQIRYENGERSPDGNYFEAIAKVGADIQFIMTGAKPAEIDGGATPNAAPGLYFEDVMDRLKAAAGAASYSDLAGMLKLSSSAYANLKKRNSIPFERVISLCYSLNVNTNWLLYGFGDMRVIADGEHVDMKPVNYPHPSAPSAAMTLEKPAPYADNPSENRRLAAMADLLDGLSDAQRQEICLAVAEKKRLNELERLLIEVAGGRKSA